jgi:hypothetical protein
MTATRNTNTRRTDAPTPCMAPVPQPQDQLLDTGLLPRLRQAGSGTRARVMAQMRRQVGNHAAQLVIRRRTVTDAQQWTLDWAAHPAQQGHFRATGRPPGRPCQRYGILAPLVPGPRHPRPMPYLAASITTATFYGFSTPVHQDLAAALRTAEATLRGQGITTAPVTKVWALNARTTSGGRWSNHTDGRAVDLDPGDNPHLTNKAQRCILSLVSGTDLEAGARGTTP